METTPQTCSLHQRATRLVIVTRHRLDGDALAALFLARDDFRVLCTATSVRVATVVCQHRRPDIVLIDGQLVGSGDCRSIGAFQKEIGEVPVLVLDDEVDNVVLGEVLAAPLAGYFTRACPLNELAEGMQRLVGGERAFDPLVQVRIQLSKNGWQIRHDEHRSPLATLTPREIEILKLIALGNSVKDCAEILELAPSTVDNHKSRLMKKLGVHKSLELTRLAVREGLVRL